MKGIIIVLGAPNSPEGILSEIAKNRLDCAARFYNNNPDFKIVCTGGFGPHFNTTDIPHAIYAIKYLTGKHIPENAFIEYTLSSNTFEDASLTKPVLDKYNPRNVVVITSDFHMKRVTLIFNKYLINYNLLFVEASSTLDKLTLDKLYEHEFYSIKRFMQTE